MYRQIHEEWRAYRITILGGKSEIDAARTSRRFRSVVEGYSWRGQDLCEGVHSWEQSTGESWIRILDFSRLEIILVPISKCCTSDQSCPQHRISSKPSSNLACDLTYTSKSVLSIFSFCCCDQIWPFRRLVILFPQDYE